MTKKRRPLFIVLGVVCVCVLSCAFVLTGCGNKHKFSSDEWTYDETSHWHQCTKHEDDPDDVEDKAGHTWSDWEGTEATCTTAAADRSRYCTVCGYTETDTSAALGHDYVLDTESKDYVAATCEKGGTDVYTCSRCDASYTEESNPLGHNYVVTVDWTSLDEDALTVNASVTCDNGCGTTYVQGTDYTVTVTASGETYTATVKIGETTIGSDTYTTGSTQEPEVGEGTEYSVTVNGNNLSTSGVSGYDYALSLDITDATDGTGVVYGSDTLTATLFADDKEVEGATASWDVDEDGEAIVSVENGVVTAKAAGEATVTVTYYGEDGTTVLAKAVIAVTVVNSREPGNGIEIPADAVEVASSSVDFNNADTYGWITTDTDGKIANAQSFTSTDGLLTLASKAEDSSTPMQVKDVNWSSNSVSALAVGGTTSEEDSYIAINLGGYEGGYVSVKAVMSNTGSSNGARYLMLATEKTPTPTDSTVLTFVSSEKNNGGQATLEYAMAITADVPTLYLTWSSSIYIYSVEVTIYGEEEVSEVGGTKMTLTEGYADEEKNYFANPSDGSLTAETATDADGNVTITVTGTASTMTADEANDFWAGHAQAGDAYIVITVTFQEGETVSWTGSDGNTRTRTISDYSDGTFDVVIRISGVDLSVEIAGGKSVYTISGGTNPVTYTVDFSQVTNFGATSRVAVTFDEDIVYGDENADYGAAVFENIEGFEIEYDETTGKYVLKGNANVMGAEQVSAWNKGNTYEGMAEIGDAYVVYGILLQPGDTISGLKNGATFTNPTTETADYYVFIISVKNGDEKTYTITTVNGEEITITIDFTGVVLPAIATDGAVEVAGSYTKYNGTTFENTDGFKVEYDKATGTFVLTGIANKMTEAQTKAFYEKDDATGLTLGEDFIVYGIPLAAGDTLINLKTGFTCTYSADDTEYVYFSHVSGNKGYYVYEIIHADGTITLVKVSFAGVTIAKTAEDTEVTATGVSTEHNGQTFTNTTDFTVNYKDGEFVLSGNANVMDASHAAAFGGEAQEGDYYVVFAIELSEGQTVTNLQSGFVDTYSETNTCYYMIVRLTKTEGHLMYTLEETDANGNTTVTLIKITYADVDITWNDEEDEPGSEPTPDADYTIEIEEDVDEETGKITMKASVKLDGTEVDISDGSITWSSEDETVATIDSTTGVVTVVSTGMVKIVATYKYGEEETDVVTAEKEINVTYVFQTLTINISELYSSDSTSLSGEIGSTDAVKVSVTSSSSMDANNKTDASGVFTNGFSYRLKLSGSGTTSASSIKFELDVAADVTVWMVSSNGDHNRIVNFFTEDGTTEYQKVGVASPSGMTGWTVSLEAGTYYLGSASSGINIYAIVVSEYTGNYTNDKPADDESTAWSVTAVAESVTLYYLGGGDEVTVEAGDLVTVTLSGTSVTGLTFGGSSSDTSVMTLSSSVFTIKGAGSTTLTITLTYGNGNNMSVTATVSVTVVGYSVEISGDGVTNTTVTIGNSFTLTLKGSDGQEVTENVTYTIDSDTNSVSETIGTFSAAAEGTATITVKVGEAEIGTITITVEAASGVGGDDN